MKNGQINKNVTISKDAPEQNERKKERETKETKGHYISFPFFARNDNARGEEAERIHK